MVDIARKLVPMLEQVVLVGDPLGSKGYWQVFPEEVPEIAKHLTVVDLTGLPMADVKQRVASLPETAAILYTGLFTDGAGASFTPNSSLAVISEAANRPVVIDTETLLGSGGVGGPVTSQHRIGEAPTCLACSQWRRCLEHLHQGCRHHQAFVRLASVATLRDRREPTASRK